MLFQTFDQDRVVEVFAANEGESIVVGREREMQNSVTAQVADQLWRVVIAKRLKPERILRPIDRYVVKTLVVTFPGDAPVIVCVGRQGKDS